MKLLLLLLTLLPFSLVAQESTEVLKNANFYFYDYAINQNENSEKVADSLFQKLLIEGAFSPAQLLDVKMKHTLLQWSLKEKRIKVFDSLLSRPGIGSRQAAQVEFVKKIVEYKSVKNPNIEELIQLHQKCKDENVSPEFLSFTLSEIALKYAQSNQHPESIATYHKARWNLSQGKTALSPHSFNQRIGQSYFRLDRLDSCLFYLEKSYHQMKETKNPSSKLLSQYSWNAGSILEGRVGNIYRARPYLQESLDHYIKAFGEDDPMLVSRYVILSNNHYADEDLQKAAFYAQKADALGERVLTEKDVYLRTLIAFSNSDIAMSKGAYDKAEIALKKVLDDNIKTFGIGNSLTVSTLYNTAYAQDYMGKYEEAEQNYLKAIEGAKEINRTISITSSLDRLSTFYIKHGEYEKGLTYAIEERDTLQSRIIFDSKIKFRNRVRIATAHIGLHEFDKAKQEIDFLEDYSKTFSNFDDIDIELLGLKLEYSLKKYEKDSDLLSLQEGYQSIPTLIDKILAVKAGYQYESSKIFFNQSVLPYIENAMNVAFAMNETGENKTASSTILQLMELNKSTALLDGIRDIEIKRQINVPQQLIDIETKNKTELGKTKEALFSEENNEESNQKTKDSLINRQLEITTSLDSITDIYETDFPKVASLKKMNQAKKIEIYQQNVLPDKTMLLEYFVMEDQLFYASVTKNTFKIDRVKDAEKIKERTEKMLTSIKNRTNLQEDLGFIGSRILPELPEQIESLVIIPDGFLSSVPFEVLKKNDTYLINTVNVSYAGSIQLFEKQKEISKKTKGTSLAGFAPEYAKEELVANVEEVISIVNNVNGSQFVGKQATKQIFLEEANEYAMLHLATHGELNNKNPMLNKLVFSENGKDNNLKALEIYSLNLDASLVTLSACETGTGKMEVGEGVMSMSRAFTYAGVSSTLVSLWKVPDQQTSQIMISFYNNLEKGQPKNEALRNAKLSYLESTDDSNLTHPYYWSGFILTGDIAPIEKRSSMVWIFLGLVAFSLIIVANANRRKKKAA